MNPFGSSPLTGIICMWSGAIVDIPDGWVLCDGNNGTPDLRNRFVLGAPDGIDPGDIGGTTAHRHPVIGTTAEEDVEHHHDFVDDYTEPIEDDGDYDYATIGGDYKIYSEHVHEFSSGTQDAIARHAHLMNFQTQLIAHYPPYYKILFIIKL